MTLLTGTRLSHYEITSQIGKGGMGEVYQAKDQKLGRDVAIKVLPEEFARDHDRIARFQREAKLLASLNHPNIAAIYGLEESEGTHFLVMELVEGDTLADRLRSGPIPVEEALKLALQIAEALEAAHDKGVIHRDLKPANIKITPDGKVKVLDFGLAKAFAGDQGDLNPADSPTLSVAATQKGVILGTAAYMSPEQARGKPVDKRTDVWAFGVVLYEMLSGRSLFAGEDVSSTLARVLEREPDFSALQSSLHFRIRLMLERCLKKDPRDRYGSISDARVDIQDVLADPSGILNRMISIKELRTRTRTIVPWIIVALAIGAIIAGAAVWILKPIPPSESHPVVRFEYDLPEGQTFGDLESRAFAISPDGYNFVYCTDEGLYVRSINELEARQIDGTESAQNPFFSPDGQWIGYWSTKAYKMLKIPISGGAPQQLTDRIPLGAPDWYLDETIVFGQAEEGILRISARGGRPELVVKSEGPEIFTPKMLPDGNSMLFTQIVYNIEGKVVLRSLKSGENEEIFSGDTAQYLPTGHIVYTLNNTLYAIPFSLDKLETKGDVPKPVIEGILRTGGAPQYAISDSGTLMYIPETMTALQRMLVWVDRNGNEEPLGVAPELYWDVSLSPDGTRVALYFQPPIGSGGDIWVWDTVRKTLERLTSDDVANFIPLWAPDGKKIVYYSQNIGLYWKATDGKGESELLWSIPGSRLDPRSWADKGKTLIFEKRIPPGTTSDIAALSIEGDRKFKYLLDDKFVERQPQVSPDGHWLAYTSDELGREEVFVRSYPDVKNSRKIQVSRNGGSEPLWSPDSTELFYHVNQSVMAVSINTNPDINLDSPKELFRGNYLFDKTSHNWDIHPFNKRFLMIKPLATTNEESTEMLPRKIIVVLNWFEELKQLVPVK